MCVQHLLGGVSQHVQMVPVLCDHRPDPGVFYINSHKVQINHILPFPIVRSPLYTNGSQKKGTKTKNGRLKSFNFNKKQNP